MKLSQNMLEPLREDEEFILNRGHVPSARMPVARASRVHRQFTLHAPEQTERLTSDLPFTASKHMEWT